MNILIISSGPRKDGNSEVLCERFVKGAFEAGHTVETILLREKSILPCRACYACMETHRCIIRDDMGQVFQKLLAADVKLSAPEVEALDRALDAGPMSYVFGGTLNYYAAAPNPVCQADREMDDWQNRCVYLLDGGFQNGKTKNW